jgi:hypothetical protein
VEHNVLVSSAPLLSPQQKLVFGANVSFAQLDVVSRRTPAYNDKEYYDYDYSKPETKVMSEEHDLSELVKAWKEAKYCFCFLCTAIAAAAAAIS